MQDTLFDVLILGGGPAGLTAGLYTSRAELNTLTIAGNPPGGQLMLTTDVENFPGFPEGIMGPELIAKMRAQTERFTSNFVDENVTEISGDFDSGFTAQTDGGKTFSAKTVIVASGAVARWLNIPSETKLRGKGVSACATCDGFFFKDQTIAVVGGGDSAMEEATFLTRFSPKVYVLVRKDEAAMKASKIMIRRAKENEKIEILFNTEVKEVLGEEKVTGLQILNNKTNEESTLDVTGLFLAIGHVPNTNFLKGFIALDELGYAKAQENTFSSKEGVFIAGDVYDHRYRQAVTAAGFGCMAALDVEKFLAEQDSTGATRSDDKSINENHWESKETKADAS